MFLVVNADDYGYSDTRDDGILECYRQGAVSNASLMVNGFSAARAVEKAKLAGLPMGLHLNLTEGTPIVEKKHETLVNKDGMFLGKTGLREAVTAGTINLEEVEAETQAQVDRFAFLTGSLPLNVDGHQHIHVIPGICEVFSKVLQQNNVTMTRLPIESGVDKHRWQTDKQAAFMTAIVHQSTQAENVFSQHGIGAGGFAGLRIMGQDMSAVRLKACILEAFSLQATKTKTESSYCLALKAKGDNVPASNGGNVCELMVHPGKVTGKDGGCGQGPDLFSQSPDREHEMAVLLSKEMREFYRDNHIQLVAFKDCEVIQIKPET